MRRASRRNVPGSQPGVPGPQRKVRLLRVEEERLVPRCAPLPAFAADQHRGTFGPVREGVHHVAPVVHHYLAQQWELPCPPGTEQRVTQCAKDAWLAAEGRNERASTVDDVWHGDPGAWKP